MKTQGFEARFSQNLAPVSLVKPQNPYLAYISHLFSKPYIEKVPNRNSPPPPFFDLILTEKEIKSKKEPLPTSQNYPMILSTI